MRLRHARRPSRTCAAWNWHREVALDIFTEVTTRLRGRVLYLDPSIKSMLYQAIAENADAVVRSAQDQRRGMQSKHDDLEASIKSLEKARKKAERALAKIIAKGDEYSAHSRPSPVLSARPP